MPPAPIPAPAEEYPGLFLYDRDGNRFVSARRLRDVLWLTTGFSGWIKFQTTRAGCVEGQDYRVITQGDGSFDFMLTVSTAICLAVVASSNRGREIRDYLSKSEEEWNTPAQVIDRALRLVQKQLTTDRN
ncbi:MAG: antA/AntB antirepressor family protein [Chitinispirillia bacterium]|nr:antA/AntB antirepressor family protein [Chitinispirillia bacterium]